MNESLSIGELVEIVGGQLVMSSMPPLAGDLEPIHRIATCLEQVQTGDVFIWGQPYAQTAGFAEVAYASGALGVIVEDHSIEPWAGRFCLVTDDTRRALHRLACLMPTNKILEASPSVSIVREFGTYLPPW